VCPAPRPQPLSCNSPLSAKYQFLIRAEELVAARWRHSPAKTRRCFAGIHASNMGHVPQGKDDMMPTICYMSATARTKSVGRVFVPCSSHHTFASESWHLITCSRPTDANRGADHDWLIAALKRRRRWRSARRRDGVPRVASGACRLHVDASVEPLPARRRTLGGARSHGVTNHRGWLPPLMP
jgi:hypothetical protein